MSFHDFDELCCCVFRKFLCLEICPLSDLTTNAILISTYPCQVEHCDIQHVLTLSMINLFAFEWKISSTSFPNENQVEGLPLAASWLQLISENSLLLNSCQRKTGLLCSFGAHIRALETCGFRAIQVLRQATGLVAPLMASSGTGDFVRLCSTVSVVRSTLNILPSS